MEEHERCKYTDDLFEDLNHVKKQCRSRIMAAIHETAKGLYEAGLMDKKTMREFDENCLTLGKEYKNEQEYRQRRRPETQS